MSTDHTDKILLNYKKAQSLLKKIVTMKEEKSYCISIMQQNMAVIGLLKSAQQMLMEDHLHSCFMHAMQSTNTAKKEEMVEEIIKVSSLSAK